MTDDRSVRDDLLDAAERAGDFPGERFHGRGIVVCAGGGTMLTNAYVLLRVLRDELRSELPVEIWHLGPREMPRLMAETFRSLGCRIVDAMQVLQTLPADISDGWQLKIYALMHSSFEEVVLLDADQVPVADPAHAFDWPAYRDAGAVFWPDIVELSLQNPVWEMLGLEARRMRAFETGQILIDKRRHWRSLAVALRMNELAETFYRVVYGDKDTMLVAWLLSGAQYHLIPHLPISDPRFLGQRDPEGSLLFQHRTNCKWRLDQKNFRPDGFVFQDACESYLAELATFWNGQDFEPPVRSLRAMQLEAELVSARSFQLAFPGDRPVSLELLPGFQIGAGRTAQLANWCVEDSQSGLQLVIFNAFGAWLAFEVSTEPVMTGRTLSWSPRNALLARVDGQREALTRCRMLADDFIDLYLGGGLGAPTEEELAGGLGLLSRVEAGVRERLLDRAEAAEAEGVEARAGALRQIAERLPPGTLGLDVRPNVLAVASLDDPRLYHR